MAATASGAGNSRDPRRAKLTHRQIAQRSADFPVSYFAVCLFGFAPLREVGFAAKVENRCYIVSVPGAVATGSGGNLAAIREVLLIPSLPLRVLTRRSSDFCSKAREVSPYGNWISREDAKMQSPSSDS